MAKQVQQPKPVVPGFKDVDKEAMARAKAALAGGQQEPLKPPTDAKVSDAKNGHRYTRWSERVVISQAYRTVTTKGLMDVVVISKIRQGAKNNGSSLFSHFYMNNADEVSEGHGTMNDRSMGSISSLLQATGFMPTSGVLSGKLLAKLFPSKGEPGTSSPLVGKAAVVSVVQEYKPAYDKKTGKDRVNEEGELIMEKRDNGESFLPDTAAAPVEADDTEE